MRVARAIAGLALLAATSCGGEEPSPTPAGLGAGSGERGSAALPEAPPDPLAPLPPAPIAGLDGLTTTSAVRYDAAPDRPHELTVTFVFPERMRWWLALEGGATASRIAEYRFGSHYYHMPPGSAESRELTGDERAEALRRTELRRALLLWPAGFPWTAGERSRTASLPLDRPRDPTDPTDPANPADPAAALGSLVAELDAGGRPRRMAVLHPDGTEQEALLVLGWIEREGRAWPDPVELHVGGARVWSEQLRSVGLRVGTGSGLFLPVDRLGLGPGRVATPVEPAALPAEWSLRIALDPGMEADLTGADAREAAWSWLAGLAERHAADRARLELDREGRCLGALLGRSQPPPPGESAERRPETDWAHSAETPALTRFLAADAALDGGALQPLFDRVPSGYRPARPTARRAGAAGRQRLQVVLPLQPD